MGYKVNVFHDFAPGMRKQMIDDMDYYLNHVNRLMVQAEERGFVFLLTKPQ